MVRREDDAETRDNDVEVVVLVRQTLRVTNIEPDVESFLRRTGAGSFDAVLRDVDSRDLHLARSRREHS